MEVFHLPKNLWIKSNNWIDSKMCHMKARCATYCGQTLRRTSRDGASHQEEQDVSGDQTSPISSPMPINWKWSRGLINWLWRYDVFFNFGWCLLRGITWIITKNAWRFFLLRIIVTGIFSNFSKIFFSIIICGKDVVIKLLLWKLMTCWSWISMIRIIWLTSSINKKFN